MGGAIQAGCSVSTLAEMQDCRALVVDDDAAVLALHARALARAGATVRTATSGREAVEVAREWQPELILTDMNMADGDGMAVITATRAEPWGADVAVIVLSGVPSLEVQLQALSRGADDFVAKPTAARLMVARAANLIALRRAERRARELSLRLRRFVAAPVLRADDAQEPEQIEATVLFTDLRGFTSTLRTRPARQVYRALWEIHAAQVGFVHSHDGYIDKFTGDGMLAIFEGPDGPARACASARAIVRWAAAHPGFGPFSPVPIGLGLQRGELLRGVFGTEQRQELTVIGDAVNVAARLCGSAGPLEVLTTPDLIAAAGERSHGGREVNIKGVGVVEVVALATS